MSDYIPPKDSADWIAEQDGGDNTQKADNPAGVSAHNDAAASGNNANAVMGYDQQIATLTEAANKLKPETEEERKKRERKERSKQIVAAVGDGLMALSNLYFTTKGAPNMYNHETMSQQKPLQDKLEKLKKEREANADKYLQYSLKIGDLNNDRAKTLRELEEQQERMKLAREKAQREQEAHGWLAALQPDKQREQAEKATKAEQEGITATEEAKNAPAMQKAKLETEKSRKKSLDASATASYASARNSNASAQEHDAKEFVAYDKSGRAHPFRKESAAIAAAKRFGTYNYEETSHDLVVRGKVQKDDNGKPIQVHSMKKGGYAGRPSPTGGSGRTSPTK